MNSVTETLEAIDIVQLLGDLIAGNDLGPGDRLPPIRDLAILLLEVRPHPDRIRWSDNRRAVTNRSHARIDSALAAGDAEQAQSEMRDHIRAADNSLLNEMRQPPAMNSVSAEGSVL